MRNLIYLLSLVMLNGCSSFVLQNPTFDNLTGVWEATGPMSYAKLIIDNNKGLLVTVNSDKDIELYYLENFISKDNGFEIEIVNFDKDHNREKVEGSVILNKILLAPKFGELNVQIWFVKSHDLNQFQELANKQIEKHNKSNSNGKI